MRSIERWISHMEIHIQKRIHVSVTNVAVKTNFVDEALWRYLSRKPRCRSILNKYRRRCRLFRCAVSRQVLVKNEVPMHFYIKRFPLQRHRDFFRRAIEFMI